MQLKAARNRHIPHSSLQGRPEEDKRREQAYLFLPESATNL
jgi:hypothetical protein